MRKLVFYNHADFLKTLIAVLVLYIISTSSILAQATTTWKGLNNDWSSSSNWTNGVPDSDKDAIIAKTSNDPEISKGDGKTEGLRGVVTCRSLTIKDGATLYITNVNGVGLFIDPVNVIGDLTIESGGKLVLTATNLTVSGNWTNNGSYDEKVDKVSGNDMYPTVSFLGTNTKYIGGSSNSEFSQLSLEGTVILNRNVKVVPFRTGAYGLKVTANSTLDPQSYKITITPKGGVGDNPFIVESGATIKVKTSKFDDTYTVQPSTIAATSTVDYAALTGTQIISSPGAGGGSIFTKDYGILKVSGGGTKELAANATVMSAIGTGLIVEAGTLDLKTFTLNRSGTLPVPGGILSVANDATLKIGGTNTMPTGYATINLSANSTVDYYGTNQVVSSQTYGNLTLSTSGTKTMPASAMNVVGNLTSQGTVTFTAGAAINVTGNVTIGAGTTFNGAGATHTIAGNWAANGTYDGGTGKVIMTGNNKIISSTASSTKFNSLTLSGSGINITAASVFIAGDLDATGGLTQSSGGLITMQNSASKSISGSNINFQNLTIDGTVTTAVDLTVNENFTVNSGKSFSASAGTVTMAGASKIISNSGTTTFSGLSIRGATSTSSNITINSSLSGASALTATEGIVTFGGTSTFGNSHNLFNVDITGTSLTMLANANMNVAGALTRTGAFNVAANTPNTVTYNGTVAQPVLGTTYHHLVFSNGGAKTAGGAVTVNGDVTINTGATFSGSSFSHSVAGNWAANGTYTPSTSTVTFTGSNNTISGTASAPVFNNLTINGPSITVSFPALQVLGNVAGTGGYKQVGNGTLTMVGTDKTISGANHSFQNLTIDGIVTNAADFTVNGNFAVNSGKSFSASAGTVTMAGADKSIVNNGTAIFSGLTITSATRSGSSFKVSSSLNGAGKLTASAGTITFDGATNFSGVHDLFNADIPTGKSLTLLSGATLGIAGAFTASGSIDATTNAATVNYNGSGSQTILPFSYHHLQLSTGGVKTFGSGTTNIAGNFTVSGATANATENSATVNYNGTGVQTILPINYHHLQLSTGGVKTFGSGITGIAGNFTISGATANTTTNLTTIDYNGSGVQTLAGINYHHLTLSNSGTKTLPSTAMTLAGNLTSMGSASATAAGNLTIGGNVVISGTSNFNGGAAALSHSIGGNVTIDAGATLNGGSASHTIAGNWVSNGTFIPSSSMVVMSGNSKAISGSASAPEFNNLTLSGTGISINIVSLIVLGDLNLAGGLSQASGGTIIMQNNASKSISGSNINFQNLTVDGTVTTAADFTVNGNFTVNNDKSFSASAGTVTMAGAGKSITSPGAATFSTLNIAAAISTGSNFTVNSALNGSGKLSASAGIMTCNGAVTFSGGHDLHDISVPLGKSLTLSSSATLGIGGSLAALGTVNATANASTVNYKGSGAQDVLPINYHHLAFSTGGSKKLGSGTTGVAGDLTVSGATADAASNFSTVDYNGSGAQSVAPITYHHLTVSKSAGTATYTSGASQSMGGTLTINGGGKLTLSLPKLNVAGGVSITSGTLETAGSSAIDLKGNWSRSGTFTPNSGTVTFSGEAGQTVSGTTFNNLTKTGGGTLTTSTSNSTLNGNLDVQGGTLVLNGHTMNRSVAGGTLTLASGATLRVNNASRYPTNFTTNSLNAGSTVIYSGGSMAMAGVTYGNLTVQDASIRALTNPTRVAGVMTVASGVTINNSTTVTLTLDKDLVNNGTINTTNTSLVFAGTASNLNGTGATTIQNLTINSGAGLTVNKNIALRGNLTNNGTGFSIPSNQIDFTSTLASTIGPASGTFNIDQLRISKTGATPSVTINADLAGLQSINVASGILDATSRNLSKTAGGGTSLTVASDAIMKVNGTKSLPDFDSYTLNSASTVEYYGTAQAVKALQYGNLSLKNTGTKIFDAGMTSIAGAFTLAGGATANLLSNSSVLNFNGGAGQALPGLNYHVIQASGTGEKTLAGTATVANKLEMISGTVNTGINRIALGSTATIIEGENSYVTGLVETQRTVSKGAIQSFGGLGIELMVPDTTLGVVAVTRETGSAAGTAGNGLKRQFAFSNPGYNHKLNATLTYHYFEHELNGLNENELAYYRSLDGKGWEQHGTSIPNPSTNRVGVTGVSNLNRMALGGGNSPLPVDLGYFKAEKRGNEAVLTWTTTSEEENRGFGVEVSVDGQSYRQVGYVSKGTGTSRVAVLYGFTDREAGKQGVRYYRLRQEDFDGRVSYYGPRALMFEGGKAVSAAAYPNPFQDVLNLTVPDAEGEAAMVRLSDTSGRIVLERSMVVENGGLTLDMSSGKIPAGMYLLMVETGDQLHRIRMMKK